MVPALGEGLEARSGEVMPSEQQPLVPEYLCVVLPSASLTTALSTGALLGHPPPICFCKNNQKHLNALPFFTHGLQKQKPTQIFIF